MLRTNRMMLTGILMLMPVMLCFIGVGALLHVVVRVAMAEHEAEQAEAEGKIREIQLDVARLQAAIQDLQRRIGQIRTRQARAGQAEDQAAELERLKQELARLESQRAALQRELEHSATGAGVQGEACETLRQQLEDARRQLESLTRKLSMTVPAATAGELPPDDQPTPDELQAGIAELQQALQEEQRKNEQAQAEWDGLQIQPDGSEVVLPSGTEDWEMPRNPLYVECDARGVVLQPEAERMPAEPGQPDQDRFLQLAARRGYVLFLIRPDGFGTFRRYRALLGQEPVHFGYEPINQTGRMIYPQQERRT